MGKPNKILQEIEGKIAKDTVLFFDLDGTLVDTDFANYLSYKKAIKSVLDYDIIDCYDKRFNRSLLKKSFPDLSEVELKKVIKEKENNYINQLSLTKLNEEMADVLIKYSTTNTNILVTNCRKDRAVMTLNYHGILDLFDKLVFREPNLTNGKINKFVNAIEVLNITPGSVVVFENEELEIEDAICAGIPVENIIYLLNHEQIHNSNQ